MMWLIPSRSDLVLKSQYVMSGVPVVVFDTHFKRDFLDVREQSPVPTYLVTSPVLVLWSVYVESLGCAPDADDPP